MVSSMATTAADGGFADWEYIPVSLDDMVDGLSFLYKRGDDVIELLEITGGKVKTVMGTDQSAAVFPVSGFCIIDVFHEMAVPLLVAGFALFSVSGRAAYTKD